jgi:hypothetical protein
MYVDENIVKKHRHREHRVKIMCLNLQLYVMESEFELFFQQKTYAVWIDEKVDLEAFAVFYGVVLYSVHFFTKFILFAFFIVVGHSLIYYIIHI